MGCLRDMFGYPVGGHAQQGALGGAVLRGDAHAQHTGIFGATGGQLAGAEEGRQAQAARFLVIKTQLARRLLQRFDEIEYIGRAAAGNCRNRIQHRLVLHP